MLCERLASLREGEEQLRQGRAQHGISSVRILAQLQKETECQSIDGLVLFLDEVQH